MSARFRPVARRLRATRWLLAALVSVTALCLAALLGGRVLVVSEPVPDPDAIVSLASHEWERLPVTAELARQYPNAVVLLTLPRQPSRHNCHDCAQRTARLEAAGIPADRIRVLALDSGGTFGEALACREFAATASPTRLLVVTSPYHTRRALSVFRSVLRPTGVTVGVVAAAATSPARPSMWFLAPYDRAYVAYEWAATAYYAFRHGVIPLT